MSDLHQFILLLNQCPTIVLWVAEILVCYVGILVMLRLFGRSGLYAYMAVVIIAANIQVLKIAVLPFFPAPVALGTVLFSGTYLCTDILTEYYGKRVAKRAVYLGFSAFLLMIIFMEFTLGFTPVTAAQAAAAGMPHAVQTQAHLVALFLPVPALLISALLSYLVSQLFDVWLFVKIRKATGVKKLWLRNNVSTMLSALIDSIVFNVLAWKLFAVHPVGWNTLFLTYILGTYAVRLVLSLLDTPFIYMAKHCIRPNDDH